MKTVEGIVSGKVEGVGYRSFVIATARAMGVCGTVRNNEDGTVAVIAQGEETLLDQFFKSISVRDSFIRVDSIEKREVQKPKEYLDFRAEY